jgi:hypothetical protein
MIYERCSKLFIMIHKNRHKMFEIIKKLFFQGEYKFYKFK